MGTHCHHHHGSNNEQMGWKFTLAFSANLVFVVIQVIFALTANSTSLLADAGHNFGDVLGLGFAGLANWFLSKPGNSNFSYGYKKLTILASLVNSILLVATCAIIIVEAIHKALHPTPVSELTVIIVALIGVLINGVSAFLFHGHHHDDANVKAAFWHLLGDALISVGVAVSASIIWLTGWQLLDPAVAIMIAVFILWGTRSLLVESFTLILDAVPTNIDTHTVKETLVAHPGVASVHDLHIWAMSTQQNALTAHLVVQESFDRDKVLYELQSTLKKTFKLHHITLQLESKRQANHCEQDC